MDQTVFFDIASLRKAVLLQSVATPRVPCPANISLSRKRLEASSPLFSTMIVEEAEGEEEESSQEGHITTESSEPSQRTTSTLSSEDSRDASYSGSNVACGKKRCASVQQERLRKPRSPLLAVATFASATSKLIRRIFSANEQRFRCFKANGQVSEEPPAMGATHLCTVPGPRRTAYQDGWKPAGQQQPAMAMSSSYPAQIGFNKAVLEHRRHKCPSRHHHSHAQGHSHGSSGPHLVKLMDGDDVGLALHALQLAAQIHDHVLECAPGPATCSDLERRQELLHAVRPPYNEAKAATRAIRHSALRSLVKEAVRRYVDPCRGAPEDVLKVILEMLTGCGGTPSLPTGSGDGGGCSCGGA